jgi:hypothetical protein
MGPPAACNLDVVERPVRWGGSPQSRQCGVARPGSAEFRSHRSIRDGTGEFVTRRGELGHLMVDDAVASLIPAALETDVPTIWHPCVSLEAWIAAMVSAEPDEPGR